MGTVRPLDNWGVNNEVLTTELFQRLLRVTQGLEALREGLKVTEKYEGLVPYLVLGGLQGLRTCEIIKEHGDDPVIEWRGFFFKKKQVVVRDEMAEQTRAPETLRYRPPEADTRR